MDGWMDSLPDFFLFFFFFYLMVRSATELDRRAECSPLPPPRTSGNGRESIDVTPWRGNTICVITSAVFMGDGIINKPPPPPPPPPPPTPAPAPVPPLLPLLSRHLTTGAGAIHAYLNHLRPIKKGGEKKERRKERKAQMPLTIILSFPVVTGAPTLCGTDMRARQREAGVGGEKGKAVGTAACVCVCV